MASDVRDVMNLPAEGGRPTKRQKTSAPRPNLKGLAREVQNLGGDNPIAIVPETSSFKKRRFGSRKPAARWKNRPFRNSARDDPSLILRHWRRQDDPPIGHGQDTTMSDGTSVTENQAETIEDSAFAKFNVQVEVPRYTEDQYNLLLASDDWTKDETDYLVDTVKSFDLRWNLIWDRYDYTPTPPEPNGDATDPNTAVVPTPTVRTMETLKKRYYEVAAKVMAAQRPVQYMNQSEFSLHETMLNFNPADEVRRKKYAENIMNRSKEEAREEESLLVEVRRLQARTEKFNHDRFDLYNRLDFPATDGGQDLSTYKTSLGLQTLLQNLMNADKSKKRKTLASTEVNTPASAGPSAHPGSTPISEHRRESIAAFNGHRDSVTSDSRPERPAKKGNQQSERKKLTEEEEKLYGVSTHERLPTGPAFRYDRINKLLANKSNAQHMRFVNTLAELDIPVRLNMPTRTVVEHMEKLLHSITSLIDLKKIKEKYDGEIKVELAKKEDRERRRAPPPVPEANGLPEAPKTEAKIEESSGEGVDANVKQEDVKMGDT